MKFLILILAISLLHQTSSDDLNLNEICHGILFQAIAHPHDRNLFIGCVQGRGTIFGCENINDVFDPNSIACVDPYMLTTTEETTSTTEEITTTTTEEPTTTTTTTTPTTTTTTEEPTTTTTTTTTVAPPPTTTESNSDCPGVTNVSFVCPQDLASNGLLIPNSQLCDRYAECFFGVAQMRFCPDGQNFDVITSTCMSPSQAFCGNRIRCA